MSAPQVPGVLLTVILAGQVMVGLVVSTILKVLVSTLVADVVVVISNETKYSPDRLGVNEVDVATVLSARLPEFIVVVKPLGSLTFHWYVTLFSTPSYPPVRWIAVQPETVFGLVAGSVIFACTVPPAAIRSPKE